MSQNLFETLTKYGEKWQVRESRQFTAEEINAISRNTIVSSEFGLSVCFYLKSGGCSFIPLSNTSKKGIGESIDMTTAKVLTLGREGEKDIHRVEE